MLQIANLLKAN